MASKVLQRILEEAPRGQPLDTDMLKDMGVSPSLATYMVSAGWLRRLAKGAYLITGDTPTLEGTVAYLSRRVPRLHVGGKTALEWQSVRLSNSLRAAVVLWGAKSYEIPDWVGFHFQCSVQTTRIFDDAFTYDMGLHTIAGGNPHVLVSEPERALLELASDVGKTETTGSAIKAVGALADLCPQRLGAFLAHCTRVKVVRMVRDLGLASKWPWGADLSQYSDRLRYGKRWSNVGRTGEHITLKA